MQTWYENHTGWYVFAKDLRVMTCTTFHSGEVKIHVTKKGKEFILRAPSPLQEQLANSLMGLTELEQSTISLSLQRVVFLMQAEDIDAAPILQTGSIDKKNV